ncbi:aa3-type cytochrome oxidase subunit II [Pseudactinotalea suaedae]|uniref:aa3-type cytochrome oxidase subunit II n=1 Tax=Pseudactinotalea suaedae TaxID=1524924 RepID=UPI001F4F13B8|nr:cytochrome c oxidase subunit II [Pseudactinotalea suaedae]
MAAAAIALISSCSPEAVGRGWMPTGENTTDETDAIVRLWTGSWLAALIIGVLVWGLIIWCVIVYRKRKDDHQLPVQLRYHLPLELLYTFIPIIMVGVLFFYTVRTQDSITEIDRDETDLNIQVYGRQWSWDFNYLDYQVWDTGQPADLNDISSDPDEGLADYWSQDQVPTLVLPVGQTVEFTLNSRDVMHSFWIPAFLYKLDTIPGRTNAFQVTPQVEGTYYGRCAELCGEYHAYMLFNVEVVSQAEFEQHMADLAAAGQTGELGEDYNRDVAPENPQFGEEEDQNG